MVSFFSDRILLSTLLYSIAVLIAFGPEGTAFGLEAAARQGEPGWTLLRSFKRDFHLLGPVSAVEIRVPTSSDPAATFRGRPRPARR